jgi:hypothetical protein
LVYWFYQTVKLWRDELISIITILDFMEGHCKTLQNSLLQKVIESNSSLPYFNILNSILTLNVTNIILLYIFFHVGVVFSNFWIHNFFLRGPIILILSLPPQIYLFPLLSFHFELFPSLQFIKLLLLLLLLLTKFCYCIFILV